MRRLKPLYGALAMALLLAGAVHAGRPQEGPRQQAGMAGADTRSYIGVNNLQMLVSNVGSFAFDPGQHFGRTDGLYFPRGTNKTLIFAAGLWVGATVNGSPRVALGEHATEWGPGTMSDGTYTPDKGSYRVYKINRGDDATTNNDYANWPVADGAPVVRAFDGSDSLDGDGKPIPLILGDQALWSVFNDADVRRHNSDAGSSNPLGLEVQHYTFAYARSGALGNTIYMKYTIINKGDNLLEDAWVSIWADADVGDAWDDLVGCDTVLGLGYAYNEGGDLVYGEEAPCVGFDFLRGPRVASPGDTAIFEGRQIPDYRNLPMTVFNNYDNSVDPQNILESYNIMRGLQLNGDPITDPLGDTTKFQFSGDPTTGEGWNDVNGADRRFLMSSGPFTMAPGDTQEVVVAVLVGQGADYLSSISDLKSSDEQTQAVFDLNFDIPFPPPAPNVWVQPLPGQIEIVWDDRAEGDVQESDILGQRFVMEGYNVYQGKSIVGPWTRIATYDVDNTVGKLYADRFDSKIGATQRVLVQNGSNSGLENHITISTDRLNGGRLIDYENYYFAVSAYSYDENNLEEYRVGANVAGHLTEVLETRVQGMAIMPHSIAVDLVDTAAHAAGSSDGMVIIQTLDHEAVTSSAYEVTFNEDLTWNLDNLTSGMRLLENQDNTSGNYTYELTEGVMVRVSGPDPGLRDAVLAEGAESWLAGVPWAETGKIDYSFDVGWNFFGSSIVDPRELIDVELRFSTTETQGAYVYTRGSEVPYAYDGWGTVPFTAWDISVEPARQLAVCFVEQFGLASNNRQWLPPDDDELGGREYLFILKSDYTDEPVEYYTGRNILFEAEEFDVMYAWWPAVVEGHSNAELTDGQKLEVSVYRYNTPEDRFTFNTHVAGEDPELARSIDDIHPVPNPWYHGINDRDGSKLNGMEFVNLVDMTATVEIYNLAGERIATVEKTDPSSAFVVWDVLTEHGLPLASGLYIYRVIVPGLGVKVGKLAIFTEEERLSNF